MNRGKQNTYALPLIVDAINRIDLGQIGSEFRIADYGSAQGQNSLLPMKTAIAQIRALAANSGGATTPISITHTNLPTNDWTTLFQTVLFSPDSYLVGEQDVFCFASGTSVYQQIFPPNHIAFGYSAIVEHWLSRKPCNIPNEIWSVRAIGRVRDIWAAQAKADWHAFLQYRALEMQPSAQLLIVGSGADAKGNSGAEGLIDLANHILQQLVKDGTLYPSEYEQMAIRLIIALRKSGKSRLLLNLILFADQVFHSMILKNSGWTTFTWSSFNATITLKLLRQRTPDSSKQRTNRACS